MVSFSTSLELQMSSRALWHNNRKGVIRRASLMKYLDAWLGSLVMKLLFLTKVGAQTGAGGAPSITAGNLVELLARVRLLRFEADSFLDDF
eukprot:5859255-Pyramimonas_sp.AAC.1